MTNFKEKRGEFLLCYLVYVLCIRWQHFINEILGIRNIAFVKMSKCQVSAYHSIHFWRNTVFLEQTIQMFDYLVVFMIIIIIFTNL
ncbi:hypothetical protein ES703_89795 [subsurface metagenome]